MGQDSRSRCDYGICMGVKPATVSPVEYKGSLQYENQRQGKMQLIDKLHGIGRTYL